jgi:hypothetical protein
LARWQAPCVAPLASRPSAPRSTRSRARARARVLSGSCLLVVVPPVRTLASIVCGRHARAASGTPRDVTQDANFSHSSGCGIRGSLPPRRARRSSETQNAQPPPGRLSSSARPSPGVRVDRDPAREIERGRGGALVLRRSSPAPALRRARHRPSPARSAPVAELNRSTLTSTLDPRAPSSRARRSRRPSPPSSTR